ncbi:MAG: hypothetical protein ABIG89_02050, partial [Candidatus Woesearchaeota archaeon]
MKIRKMNDQESKSGRESLYLNLDKDMIKLVNSYKSLKDKYKSEFDDVINILDKDVSIPFDVFVSGRNLLESLSCYLVDSLDYSFDEISLLLNRNIKIVTKAYNSKKKTEDKSCLNNIYSTKSLHSIKVPLVLFRSRSLSMMEHLVKYLKESYNLKFSQIAKLLNKDQRTIWTIYMRSCKKYNNNN